MFFYRRNLSLFGKMQVLLDASRVAGEPQISQLGSRRTILSEARIGVQERKHMLMQMVRSLWCDESGQDIAEYAVMLAVILVIVVGTIRLIGSNANNVFSNVASSIQ